MSLIHHGIFLFMLACASSGVAGDAPSRESVLEARLSSLVQRVDANAIVMVRTSAQEGNEGVELVDVKILSSLPDFPGQVLTLVRQMSSSASAVATVQVRPLPRPLMPAAAPIVHTDTFTLLVNALASPAANTVLMLVALGVGTISAWLFVILAALGARRVQMTFLDGVAHLSEAVRDRQPKTQVPELPLEAALPVVIAPPPAPKFLLASAKASEMGNTDTIDTEFCARSFVEQERFIKRALDLQK